MRLGLAALCLLLPCFVSAQLVEQSATYVSPLDQALDLRKISILPVSDNVNSIYARPIESRLIETLQKNHQWDYVETKVVGPVLSPMELENDSKQVQQLGLSTGADTLVAVKATKGPDGMSLTLDIFLTYDGLLFAQEELKKYPNTNVADIQAQSAEMLKKALGKIPFQGQVLSRDGNRVTVNIGTFDGIKKDQVVSAAQIIKLNRHPKFNFVVSADKEILGKIKLEKVDDTLSFGTIITETERGVIRKHSKITGLDAVTYSNASGIWSSGEGGIHAGRTPEEQAADKVAFGKNPSEWVPVRPPTFGKVGLFAGLGSYTLNSTAISPRLNMTTSQAPFLNLKLTGEIWITPTFTAGATIRQGVFSAANPRSGSLPSDLSFSVQNYDFKFGYNFLILEDFWGPKIQLEAGFTQYKLYVDQTYPTTYTSMDYRGLILGLKGLFPVDPQKIYFLGVGLDLVISPAVNETPFSSGATATNTVSAYHIFGTKKIGERLELAASLDFELYASEFAGAGTRTEVGVNTSQRLTTAFLGINYLF